MKKEPMEINLLQSTIVTIDRHHKKVITDSLQISKSLDVRHYDIVRKIESLSQNGLLDKRYISFIKYKDSANRNQKAYELNEQAALQLIMGLSGVKAAQFHKHIAQRFIEVKEELYLWQAGRKLAINTTKQANNELQWLHAELAKVIPTSKRCTMLYHHVQIAINKAVVGKGKSLDRNNISLEQLDKIQQLQGNVQAKIKVLKGRAIDPEKIRNDVLSMIREQV